MGQFLAIAASVFTAGTQLQAANTQAAATRRAAEETQNQIDQQRADLSRQKAEEGRTRNKQEQEDRAAALARIAQNEKRFRPKESILTPLEDEEESPQAKTLFGE